MKPIHPIDAEPLRHSVAGVDKPRGLQNAALQHERKAREVAERSTPAAVVSLSNEAPQPITYARVHAAAEATTATSSLRGHAAPDTHAGAAGSSVQLGEGSSLHINSRVDDASGSSTIVVGDGSHVHINSRAGSTSGHDTLIVGDDAKVHINQRVERDGGSDTIILGDGATLHLNSRVRTDTSSDTLRVADGASRFIQERSEWTKLRAPNVDPASDSRAARSWSAVHFVQAQVTHPTDHGIRAKGGPERAAAGGRPAHAHFDALAYMLHELVEKAPKLNETADEKRALHATGGKERESSPKQSRDVSE